MPDLVFKQLVYNRLPFLAVTADNDALINSFFVEEAYELEPCFRVGVDDASLIGVEENYNVYQKSILADIVAMYIIMVTIAANSEGRAIGDVAPTPSSLKFLSKAKAGSADVEWKQIDIANTSGFFMKADGLISMYKSSAARKARNLGCILDICDSCATNMQVGNILPFITVTDCGCC